MTGPGYINLADLPPDTIVQKADNLTVVFTADPETRQLLVPNLIVDSGDLGTYRYIFDREVLRSLVSQVRYYATLDAEGYRAILKGLQDD